MMQETITISKYSYPNLKAGDQDYRWCHRYAHDVDTGKIVAGKYIKLAARRHFENMLRDDLYFDVEAAKSIVLWFKFIPLTDDTAGGKAGDPTKLLPWQIWVVCSIVAWKVKSTGLRLYKYAFIRVGRKNGKTTLAGGLTLYYMRKAGFRPRCYSAATKRDQAKELWKAAAAMITLSPRLQSIFEARKHDILMPQKMGEFVPLSSDSNSLDGLNPLVANLDECHAIKDRNLYGVLVSAFGAQLEGLMLTITTAGTILDGICTDLDKNGKRVLEGVIEQDAYFYAIYEVDDEDLKKLDDESDKDEPRWGNEKVWIKANPGLGHQPTLTYLRERYIEARMTTKEKVNFFTKHLNKFVSGADKWLDMDEVKACHRPIGLDDYKGRKCYVGLDRSRVHDLTSFCLMFPRDDGGADCFWYNLLPEATYLGVVDYLQDIYQKAKEAGQLILLQSKTVKKDDIKKIIYEIHEKFDVEMFGYDPWHMREICEEVEEEKGLPMVSVSQGTGNMSEPAKSLEGLIKDELIAYDNILFEYACSCALSKTTDQNNIKIVRDNWETDKIDPVITAIIARSCATLQKVEKNPYEDRGLLSV